MLRGPSGVVWVGSETREEMRAWIESRAVDLRYDSRSRLLKESLGANCRRLSNALVFIFVYNVLVRYAQSSDVDVERNVFIDCDSLAE